MYCSKVQLLYNLDVFKCFPFFTLYLYFTAFQRERLFFSIHYIVKFLPYKIYNHIIKSDRLLQI